MALKAERKMTNLGLGSLRFVPWAIAMKRAPPFGQRRSVLEDYAGSAHKYRRHIEGVIMMKFTNHYYLVATQLLLILFRFLGKVFRQKGARRALPSSLQAIPSD